MTWTLPAPSPVDGPLTGDDRPILEGFLNWQRGRGKAADFDDASAAGAEADADPLRAEWRRSDDAVAGMGFADTFDVVGEAFSLRMVYVHMIYEYARHSGHAGLLRESIDGVTGR
jgi:hypothetical protein